MALLLSLKPHRTINQNDFARAICSLEAGKREVDIAQVKEVWKCALMLLREEWVRNPLGVKALLDAC